MNNFTTTSVNNDKRKKSRSKSKLKNKSFSQHNNTHMGIISSVPDKMNKSFK
jgi:hypothetical protein